MAFALLAISIEVLLSNLKFLPSIFILSTLEYTVPVPALVVLPLSVILISEVLKMNSFA